MPPNVRPLSKELQEKAIKNLNEVPSRVEEDIEYIKSWLRKQPHLTPIMDDQWILTYLRGCKFSLEKTKEKMDLFYTLRTMIPEVYANRDPLVPEIQEVLKIGLLIPLPDTTPDGAKVMIMRNCYDPSKISFENIFRSSSLWQDIGMLMDDEAIINGVYIIQDMEGVTFSHLAHYNPGFVKKMMAVYQKCYPSRPKGMFFINTPPAFEAGYNLFSQFMNEKMKSRMKILSSENKLEELYEVIPKSMLPSEYGGKAGSCEELALEMKKKIESCRDWLIETSKTGSNEKKRPGKPKTSEDLFGMDGSFRKLNVD